MRCLRCLRDPGIELCAWEFRVWIKSLDFRSSFLDNYLWPWLQCWSFSLRSSWLESLDLGNIVFFCSRLSILSPGNAGHPIFCLHILLVDHWVLPLWDLRSDFRRRCMGAIFKLLHGDSHRCPDAHIHKDKLSPGIVRRDQPRPCVSSVPRMKNRNERNGSQGDFATAGTIESWWYYGRNIELLDRISRCILVPCMDIFCKMAPVSLFKRWRLPPLRRAKWAIKGVNVWSDWRGTNWITFKVGMNTLCKAWSHQEGCVVSWDVMEKEGKKVLFSLQTGMALTVESRVWWMLKSRGTDRERSCECCDRIKWERKRKQRPAPLLPRVCLMSSQRDSHSRMEKNLSRCVRI